MKLQPMSHPAVWTGAELAGRDIWNVALLESEREALAKVVRGLEAREPDESGFRPPLPNSESMPVPQLAGLIHRIRSELEDGSGIVRLEGLAEKPGDVAAETMFRILSGYLGTPVSQSASGDMVFHVRDAGYRGDDPRARGPNTREELGFHTDRADVTAFMCVRPALEGGENEVVSSMAVFNEVLRRRPDLVGTLMKPFCYLRHTVDAGNPSPWTRQPVFSFRDGHFACCYLRVLIERAHRDPRLPDLTPTQIEALDLVDAIAAERAMKYRFRQSAGDVFLINNWVVLHRREAFRDAAASSKKREILRMWLSMPNSRPLDPVFRDNWGRVEAGAVRGGMRPATDC